MLKYDHTIFNLYLFINRKEKNLIKKKKKKLPKDLKNFKSRYKKKIFKLTFKALIRMFFFSSWKEISSSKIYNINEQFKVWKSEFSLEKKVYIYRHI